MRTNAVADLFKSGLVWAPLGLRWVEQLRDEMAAFPHGENDATPNISRGGRSNTIEPGENSPLPGIRYALTTFPGARARSESDREAVSGIPTASF